MFISGEATIAVHEFLATPSHIPPNGAVLEEELGVVVGVNGAMGCTTGGAGR
jgi:hypothetical protein